MRFELNKLIWVTAFIAFIISLFSIRQVGAQSWLNVTLLNPNPITCTEVMPCSWNQNNTYQINATIECVGGYCGNVNGIVRYNNSPTTMEAINTSEGATPFYIVRKNNIPSATTDETTQNVGTGGQRKTFYAVGRYWIFHANGTDIVYLSSADGTTWSGTTIFKAGMGNRGDDVSIYWDGTNVSVAYANHTDAIGLFYRQGTPQSDGSISWDDERTVQAGQANYRYLAPTVTRDTDGYPWVATQERYDLTLMRYIVAYQAENKDGSGTWTKYTLDNSNAGTYARAIIHLPDNHLYVFWRHPGASDTHIEGKMWNGTDWNSTPETISPNQGRRINAIAHDGYNLYIVWENMTSQMQGQMRTSDGWGSPEQIIKNDATEPATLTWNEDTNKLYIFYGNDSHILMKIRDGSWSNESLPFGTSFTSLTTINSYEHPQDGGIGVIWREGASSPYNVMHAVYGIAQNPISCGNLSQGQSCQLKWTVNATGTLNSVYKIDVNFTSDLGIWNDTPDATIKISESVTPQWSNQGSNTTTIKPSDPVLLYVYLTDNINLSHAILATDETGTWENKTIYGSPMTLSGTGSWANFTWQNPGVSGKDVSWRIYFNDTSGNENVTNLMTFTILELKKIYVVGGALNYYTGERINGNVTAIPVGDFENRTDKTFSNGEWFIDFDMASYVKYLTFIINDDGNIGFTQLKLSDGPSTTLDCSIQNISLSGYSVDVNTGDAITSGSVRVSVIDTIYTNITSFSGEWSIDLHPCLISGEIYTLHVSISDDSGRTGEMFENYPAR